MKLRFAFSALVFLVAMTMAAGAFAQGTFTDRAAGTEPRGRSQRPRGTGWGHHAVPDQRRTLPAVQMRAALMEIDVRRSDRE